MIAQSRREVGSLPLVGRRDAQHLPRCHLVAEGRAPEDCGAAATRGCSPNHSRLQSYEYLRREQQVQLDQLVAPHAVAQRDTRQ